MQISRCDRGKGEVASWESQCECRDLADGGPVHPTPSGSAEPGAHGAHRGS